MKLNFRQGLVSFQQSGPQPLFLLPSSTPGYVDLSIAPTPFIATIAHGESDYLLKFDTVVAPAFGPLVSGFDNHLYLQLDLITGVVSYGVTTIEPVTSLVEPASPVPGMMWFDLNETVMKVRNNNNTKWVPSPRVVVGIVQNGNTNQIVHKTVGSSVGLNVPSNPGYVLYDSQLRPLRTPSGELLTADTPVRVKTTVGTSGVLTNPVNNFIPVRAAEPIPAMSLVYFSSADTVSLASSNPALITPKIPVGVVETPLAMNEVGVVTQSGEVTYDQWNWGPADFGKPLYCGFNGEIITTRPQSVQAYRIGYVKNAKTILFYVDSETQPQILATQGSIISGVPPITAVTAPNMLSEIVTTISMEPADGSTDGYMTAAQAALLETFDTRLDTAEADIDALELGKSDVGHVHAIADVTNLQTTLDAIDAALALKMPTVPTAVQDNIATFDALGNVQDSGLVAADFALASHVHTIAQVTNLQTELDGKSPVGHTHIIANVTGLQTELDNRAFVNHTHSIANVTGLQTALDGKAPLTHTHVILDVSGLQEALDLKANLSHFHAISDVTGLQVALNGKADVSHSHALADVTNLQSTLDNKSNVGHTHVAADVTDFAEAVDDRVGNLLIAGNNITLVYNDAGNQLEIQANVPAADPLLVRNDVGSEYNEYEVTTALAFLHMRVDEPSGGLVTVQQQPLEFFEGATPRGVYPNESNVNGPAQLVFGSGLTATQSGTYGEILTIAAAVAPTTLASLDDVDFTIAPNAGDALIFNGVDWVAGAGGGSSAPLNEVVFGTGASTTSSSNFTFVPSTGSLIVNGDTSPVTAGDIQIFAATPDGSGSLNGGNVYLWAGNPGGDGGQGGEVIIRSGSNNQQGSSRSEILLSSIFGDNMASDMYLKAGTAQDGNNGGVVNIEGGAAAEGGNGGDVNLFAGNSSGGTSVFAGSAYVSAGAISGSGVEGTGGSAYLQAGSVQASFNGAYTDATGGSAYIEGGRILGATNYTGTAQAGNVQLQAGYADDNDPAKGGSIVLSVNNGAVEHRVTAYGALNIAGSAGSAGQVLMSDGDFSPPYWGNAGGGESPTFVYSMSITGGTFSGSALSSWTATRVDQELSTDVSYDSYLGNFVINNPGMYEITVSLRVSSNGSLPDGHSSFGFQLEGGSGGQVVGNDSVHHVRYTTSNFELGLTGAPASFAQNVETFTERFMVTSSIGSTFRPYAFAYNYANGGAEANYAAVITLKRVGDYVGA